MPDDPERMAKAIRFSDLRERPRHAERFFRQGQSGEGRQRLTPAQIERLTQTHAELMRRFGYSAATDLTAREPAGEQWRN